ncbi:unnamed protein product [Rhizophagus irregularis]|nr:unnamed protein product [Rhizophagus irregularis]
MKIAEWKQNQKTHNAFYKLFKNHDILTKIGHSVFKQFLTCNSTQLDSLGALRIMEELAKREAKEVSQRTDQYESAVAEESSESVENKNYDD